MKLTIRKKGKYADKENIYVIEDKETNKIIKQLPRVNKLLEILNKNDLEKSSQNST